MADKMADKNERLERAIKHRKEFAECNYDDSDHFTDDDAIDELMGECGKTRDGSCMLAGRNTATGIVLFRNRF